MDDVSLPIRNSFSFTSHDRCKELLDSSGLNGWMDQEQERKALGTEIATFEALVPGIDERDGFTSDIAEAFERSREELHAIAEARSKKTWAEITQADWAAQFAVLAAFSAV